MFHRLFHEGVDSGIRISCSRRPASPYVLLVPTFCGWEVTVRIVMISGAVVVTGTVLVDRAATGTELIEEAVMVAAGNSLWCAYLLMV